MHHSLIEASRDPTTPPPYASAPDLWSRYEPETQPEPPQLAHNPIRAPQNVAAPAPVQAPLLPIKSGTLNVNGGMLEVEDLVVRTLTQLLMETSGLVSELAKAILKTNNFQRLTEVVLEQSQRESPGKDRPVTPQHQKIHCDKEMRRKMFERTTSTPATDDAGIPLINLTDPESEKDSYETDTDSGDIQA